MCRRYGGYPKAPNGTLQSLWADLSLCRARALALGSAHRSPSPSQIAYSAQGCGSVCTGVRAGDLGGFALRSGNRLSDWHAPPRRFH